MLKSMFIMLFIASLLLCAELPALSQNSNEKISAKSPEGTEFWLCFMKNFKDEDENLHNNVLMLELFITSDKDANVLIEIKNIGYKKSLFVPAGTVKNVKIDSAAQIKSNGVVEHGAAVKIVSDNPISVYGLNCRFQTTDTFLGLPVEVLGKEYRAMCYSVYPPMLAQLAVVAVESGTTVVIEPSVNTQDGRRGGYPFEINMNKGDVFQLAAKFIPASNLKSDLTGTLIKSNKKIAVFSGHQCANVPEHIETCNHLVEQLPPLPSWGKHFYIGNLRSRSKYTYRVLANYPDTRVFENSTLLDKLQPGEFMERTTSGNIQVSADKPVLVAQYSQGMKSGDSVGDPMMLLISPTQQFLKKYRFATPKSGFWGHYINVVAPTDALESMRLNGSRIPPGEFKKIGISRYSLAQLEVPYGTHQIEANEPFGMYSYGFGYHKDAFDAYGTMGGQSFIEYLPEADTLPPIAEARMSKTVMEVIFRDDRVDDTGIKKFRVLSSDGIFAQINNFDEGIPQISASVLPLSKTKAGRAVYEIEDVAGNVALYTVCYSSLRDGEPKTFSLSKGDLTECEHRKEYSAGGFGRFSITSHSGEFATTAGARNLGNFSPATGAGGWFGVFAGKRLMNDMELIGKLTFETYGGELTSESMKSDSVRDPKSGGLLPYREGHILKLNALYLELSFISNWYLGENFYISAGLTFPLALSNEVTFKRKIISPAGWVFANGEDEINETGIESGLKSLNFIGVGLELGAGYEHPLSEKFSIFGEFAYSPRLTSLVDDADWALSKIQINAGVKIRF